MKKSFCVDIPSYNMDTCGLWISGAYTKYNFFIIIYLFLLNLVGAANIQVHPIVQKLR